MPHSDTILKVETKNLQIYVETRVPGEKTTIFFFLLFSDKFYNRYKRENKHKEIKKEKI